MAHFAKLNDDNIVEGVFVVNNAILDNENEEQSGIDFLIQWSSGHTNWKQTSYNRSFRKNYAGIGYFYDSERDAFIPPEPDHHLGFNEDTCTWIPDVDSIP